MNIDPKIALRRQFRAMRREFVGGLSDQDRAIAESSLAALAAPVARSARISASYAARRAEIDPSRIADLLPPHAFPRVSGPDIFFHLAAWKDLFAGFGGIPEPSAAAPLVIPDLVLVPLLAVTPDGRRLGQGGGFYDRALRRLRDAGRVVALGLAWDIQVTETLPVAAWDERLDFLATPSRLVDCRHFR